MNNASPLIDSRLELLWAIFAELKNDRVRYALIHAADASRPDVTSDVDMAFERNPNEVVLPILERLSEIGQFKIVQCLHYEIPHGYYYILKVGQNPAQFLHLDCLYDPVGINRYYLPTAYFLEDVEDTSGIKHTNSSREALYLLIKRAIKGKVTPLSLDTLQGCFKNADAGVWKEVDTWFGSTARRQVQELLDAREPEQAMAVLARLRACVTNRFKWQHPLRFGLASLASGMRKFRRFIHPTGFFIVLLGPDGSGKSTVSDLVLAQLDRGFRKTWRFHWRPNLLPKLGRNMADSAGQDQTQGDNAPAETSKYRGVVSLVRFAYYWLDFVLGYWLVIYPRKAQTTLILGERYFPDVLVHPQRYGFAVPMWLMRLAAKLVPSPDLVVLLKDDPEVIYARKPELSVAMIAEQIGAYQQEMPHWGRNAEIVTQGGAETVAARLGDIILAACADRTACRLGLSRAQLHWSAFPSAAGVKVWVNGNDTLSNALNLYHPYSMPGRLLKAAIQASPAVLQRAAFRQAPDPMLQEQLWDYAVTIRATLKKPEMAVSFSQGTPGPHQKFTAQASLDGSVLSYVKIGRNEAVHSLLSQEDGILRWLHELHFSGAVIPAVQAFNVTGADTLLFLSAPAQPGKQRKIDVDDKDVQFLSALLSKNAGTMAVDAYFSREHADSLLAELGQSDPKSARILQQAVGAVKHALENLGVKLAAGHGDYAPWNTLELEDGSLYVFDWEYGNREAAVLTDLFHRVLMPQWLVLGRQPAEIVRDLLELGSDPLLGRLVAQAGIQAKELSAYILIYLIGMVIREQPGLNRPSDFLLEAIGFTLSSSGVDQ